LTTYVHKDARLDLHRNKASLYIRGQLVFQGSGYPGMMQFIRHCNHPSVTAKFRSQLEMREKPKFSKNEKKEKE
tara:strand:- start:581 stop:802 length:222 start_codon:yes stop_codon:yes gene_type:complete